MTTDPTVFVVDDDQAIRESLHRLMESVGLAVQTYPTAEAFLESYDPARPGCLVLDIRMPGMTGLELQEKLARDRITMPAIIVSAHGDVEKAVQAMKAGAVDFLKKPFRAEVLLDRIRQALDLDARIRRKAAERAEIAARFDLLTPRESEVLALLVDGKAPKEIAFKLGLSRKTVDVHRGHVMTKLRADSVVDLVRMAQIHAAAEPTAASKFP
ncbi:MAG TPA: response regulator [Thermoguttaceae bacterium]|nr:response regulator [Thermoguttaceae bacterium]